MSVLMLFRRKVDPDPSTLSRADARLTDVRGAAIDSEKSYSHTSSVFSRPLCLRYGDIYDLICESGAAVHGLVSHTSASVRSHAMPYQCRACIDGVETKSAIVDWVTLDLYRNSGVLERLQLVTARKACSPGGIACRLFIHGPNPINSSCIAHSPHISICIPPTPAGPVGNDSQLPRKHAAYCTHRRYVRVKNGRD